MKELKYLFAVGLLIAFNSCREDTFEQQVTPAQTGDEITFGSALTDIQTRTIYGDEPVNGAYPVYWEEDGSDQIAIYCPQAAQGKLVKYSVKPDKENPEHSSTVTKINEDEAGLQWGQEETHKFYGFYPASAVTGTEDGKIVGEIPTVQTPIDWVETTNEAGGTTYTGVANTDYAFMWAYGTHNKSDGGDVVLTFHPWVTILDIEINGPAKDGETIKMSSVQVRSLNDEILNGKFICDMNPVEQDPTKAPTYTGIGNTASTRNQISIELYDTDKSDFITLGKNDKIVVRAYLLPKDENYDTGTGGDQQLQIRVAPFNSAVLTRTLNGTEGSVSGGIVAHKINRVILPSVSKTGPNYWMSSLDPDIFVTELSLPGSKMSYQIQGQASGVTYQDLSIADQFTNGIRAFQIQTASTNNHGRFDTGSAEDQILYMTVAGEKTGTRFKDIVEEIATDLKTGESAGKNNEYAFILLTAALGKCDSYGTRIGGTYVDGNQAWMDAIRNELAEMTADANDTYRIYTGEITPTTTIKDVAGHIIIKVNYNTDDMGNHLSTTDEIPAMFAQWGVVDDVSTEFTETSAYAVNTLRWGTSNHSVTSNLKWFYHEATSVGYNDNGGEETYSTKVANIKDMWDKSVAYYENNDDHSMWFLNDLGGCYVNGIYDSGESQNGVEGWTQFVGPYATDLLQKRTEDATLGIVLMNYANPDNQYTGNLIQTIINNNFNFQLRTSSASTANYNASYTKGGNAIGWDN